MGQVIGVERLLFGSGSNFGGSPISVSLLGNNIQELKQVLHTFQPLPVIFSLTKLTGAERPC